MHLIISLSISFSLWAFSIFSFSLCAYADENPVQVNSSAQSLIKVDSSLVDAKKMASNDLDLEVTDIKLRASSGAKSKFSSSFNVNYSGASLNHPFDDVRPNISNDRLVSPVSAAGDFGLRYRRNKNDSLFLATGFYQSRPFQKNENNDKLEISTPHLAYNQTSGSEDWQISNTYLLYLTTLDYRRKIGEAYTVGYSLAAKNKLQDLNFTAGVSMNVWAVGYDKFDEYLRSRQNDYGVSVTPGVQYNNGDKMNVYTTLSLFNYSHYRSESARPFRFDSGPITQTVGMGYAIFRDLYVSPYLSFDPARLSAEKTAVNFNATINL